MVGQLINYPTAELDAGGVPVGVTIVLRAVLLGLAGVGALVLWGRRRSSRARPNRSDRTVRRRL